ncbi:hypothetical protein PInf_006268 [Phytophthora infestans]|nr:hypothetical protein PInf_006268 [Phytophthora infestans]
MRTHHGEATLIWNRQKANEVYSYCCFAFMEEEVYAATQNLNPGSHTAGSDDPEDALAAKEAFSGQVKAAIIEHNISHVFNADQTGEAVAHVDNSDIRL